MNKNIVILGCPRSGTSLTAQLVKTAGYDADGKGSKQLMKPNPKFNPDGYFERIDIVKLNDALLNYIKEGSNFLNPPTLEQAITTSYPNKLMKEVINNLSSYSGWFIKDSRLSFTLHFYKNYLSNLHIIKCYRDKDQVKKSMENHYGNLFSEDVTHGPHHVSKVNFNHYYNNIYNFIHFQAKTLPSIDVHYKDLINGKVKNIENFIGSKVDTSIINPSYKKF